MTRKNDVVIADGVGEEIVRLLGIVELNDLLGTAESWLRLVAHELPLCDEGAPEVACYLEDGDGSFCHKAPDAYADA